MAEEKENRKKEPKEVDGKKLERFEGDDLYRVVDEQKEEDN